MQVRQPAERPLVFRDCLNAGDVAGLMTHYYAPDATYSPVPGVVLTGDEVEPAIARLAALGTPIEISSAPRAAAR